MKKVISGLIILASIAACTNANAISEGYRRQLEREGKTEMDTINPKFAPAGASKGFTHYAGGIYEVVVNKNGIIQTINGFKPQSKKKIDSSMYQYKARTGTLFTVTKSTDGLTISYTEANGESGDLVGQ